jgi:hypothetical protein
MRNNRIFNCLLFVGLATVPVFAQNLLVLQVPQPSDYRLRHQSDEFELSVTYTVKSAPRGHIYARIFMNNLEEIKAQTSSVGRGKCILYRNFWRIPVSWDGDRLMLSELIKLYRRSSRNDQDYVVVFEEGEENPLERNTFKLSRDGAAKYFDHAISFHIYASPKDQQYRYEAQQKENARPGVVRTILASIVPPVSAAEIPKTSAPVVAAEDIIVEGPCRGVQRINLPLVTATKEETGSQLVDVPIDLAGMPMPVVELNAHLCGGL